LKSECDRHSTPLHAPPRGPGAAAAVPVNSPLPN
jgi:hypothetical protein